MPNPINLAGGLTIKQESLSGLGVGTKEATLGGKIGAVVGGGTGAKWGKIKGNINEQTDLIELFNSVNVDDLNQDADTFFILNCGSSTKNVGE